MVAIMARHYDMLWAPLRATDRLVPPRGKYFKHYSATHRENTHTRTHYRYAVSSIRQYLTTRCFVHWLLSLFLSYFLLFNTIPYRVWWKTYGWNGEMTTHISNVLHREFLAPFDALRRFPTPLHYCHFVTAFVSLAHIISQKCSIHASRLARSVFHHIAY